MKFQVQYFFVITPMDLVLSGVQTQIHNSKCFCGYMPFSFTSPKTFCARPKIFLPIVAVTFCARQKYSVKLSFVLAQKFKRGTKCSQIFGLAQKIWTATKHFVTCKRTAVAGMQAVQLALTMHLKTIWGTISILTPTFCQKKVFPVFELETP